MNRVDVLQYWCGCFLHFAAVVVVFVSILLELANRNNLSALLFGAILTGSLCTRLPYFVFVAWRLPCLISIRNTDSESLAGGRRFNYGREIVVSYSLVNETVYVVYENGLNGDDGAAREVAASSGFWKGRHVRKNSIHLWGPWRILVD